MSKGRMEAFSDGVLAILITIMVLELKLPAGDGWPALRPLLPTLLIYALSFVFLGIYWNNHHHLLQATGRINGRVLWANLHLLFWLSLIPFGTAWMGEHPTASFPSAMYGVVLLLSGVAYTVLQNTIIRTQGPGSKLATAVGKKHKELASTALYLSAVGLAFVGPWIAQALYVAVALIWLIPDRRIEGMIDAVDH